MALNAFRYEIADLALYFWELDERQLPLDAMHDLIEDFIDSPRYGLT